MMLLLLLVVVLIYFAYQHGLLWKHKDPILVLPAAVDLQPKTFRLQNVTDKPLSLDLAAHTKGAQAGFASTLAPHHYSIFYLSPGPLAFICYDGALGDVAHKVDCHQVLRVDPMPSAPGKPGSGNYWMVENVT